MAAPDHVVLASASPRRRSLIAELLRNEAATWETRVADLDEGQIYALSMANGLGHREALTQLAEAKLAAVLAELETPVAPLLVVAADTMVLGPEGAAVGKPQDRAHAEAMLRAFSNNTIHVLTAIAGARLTPGAPTTTVGDVVSTAVHLTEIPAGEIGAYLETDIPWDKAGALELQGASAHLVQRYEGCWPNVLGLPLCVLSEWLGLSAAPSRCRHSESPAR